MANLYKRAGINPDECIYCGARKTDTDHLRPIVKGGRPSGFFHVTGNLVPACGPCNQSKSGLDWRAWINSKTAKGSPARRGTVDIDERYRQLERFEEIAGVKDAVPEDALRAAVGSELWDAYWRRRDEIVTLMEQAQRAAFGGAVVRFGGAER
ncbi:HNH endonuclease [Mesorhizobium sp. AR10]|uniref:HNH endonuclease n=1 Tax=Mesorhizobium sp. AR10 TaxID=2865839 RepID=UPI00215FA9FA|nr:HNH endonuclease [Mesorhizobium sp. AR10]UVK37421.1 HNH endonuclease [Mesorhizobium sp. AR10]